MFFNAPFDPNRGDAYDGPAASYSELAAAALENQRRVQNVNAVDLYLEKGYAEDIDKIKSATGINLENPHMLYGRRSQARSITRGRPMDPFNIQDGWLDNYSDPYEAYAREIDKNAEKLRASGLDPDTLKYRPLMDVQRRMRQAQTNLSQIESSMGSSWRPDILATNLIGSLYGQLDSPVDTMINIMGGVPGQVRHSLIRNMMKNAAANAAAQAALEPLVAQNKLSMGLDTSWQESFANIAAAFALGGALDVAVRGPVRGIRALAGADERFGGVFRDAAPDVPKALLPAPAIDPELVAKAYAGDPESFAKLAEATGTTSDPIVSGAQLYMETGGRQDAAILQAMEKLGIDPGDQEAFLTSLLKRDNGEPPPRVPDPIPETNRPTLADGETALAQRVGTNQHEVKAELDGKPVSNRTLTAETIAQADRIEALENRLAERVIAFERQDGTLVMHGKPNPEGTPALVLREADGWTEPDVKATAMRKAMQEGYSDSVAMAREIRQSPDLIDSSVPLTEPVQAARALAKLSDEAFAMVERGDADIPHARLIGETQIDPQHHASLLERIMRDAPDDIEAARDVLADHAPQDHVAGPAALAGVDPADIDMTPVKNIDNPKAQMERLTRELADDIAVTEQPLVLKRELESKIETIRGEIAKLENARLSGGKDASPANLEKRRAELQEAMRQLARVNRDLEHLRNGTKPSTLETLVDYVLEREAVRRQLQARRTINDALKFAREMLGDQQNIAVVGDLRDPVTGLELDAQTNIQTGDIELSIKALNPSAKLGHEGVHALVTRGMLRPGEVRLLAEASRKAGAFTPEIEAQYREAYADRPTLERQIEEEAAAHFIDASIEGKITPEPEPATIIDRVKRFFDRVGERLKNAREGAGFQTADELRDAILTGDVARRQALRDWMRDNDVTAVAVRGGGEPDGGMMYAIRQDNDGIPQTPGLDMSQDARLARARAMGFDTSTIYYHGTAYPGFDEFKPQLSRWDDGAVWFTADTETASRIALRPRDKWQTIEQSFQKEGVLNRLLGRTDTRIVSQFVSGNNGGIYPVFLKTKDFAIADFKEWLNKFKGDEIEAEAGIVDYYKDKVPGVFVKNSVESDIPQTKVAVFAPSNIRSVNAAFDPALADSSNLMYAIRQDRETGQSMRRDLDSLGYYSQALEAARGLKQAKGTPEQMLSQLKKAGVKDAEIDATGLRQALDGKSSITRDEIVRHLEQNRVALNEVKYGGKDAGNDTIDHIIGLVGQLREIAIDRKEPVASELRMMADRIERQIERDPLEFDNEQFWEHLTNNDEAASVLVAAQDMVIERQSIQRPNDVEQTTKWSNYSLDPNNPTYRETVLHLDPVQSPEYVSLNAERISLDKRPRGEEIAPGVEVADRLDEIYRRMDEIKAQSFQSGHFSEPNITGHMMTSMVKHEGQPTYLIDQIQSDWGQKLRDGGVRDEAKIAELEAAYKKASNDFMAAVDARGELVNSGEHRSAIDDALKFARDHGEQLNGDGDMLRAIAVHGPKELADRAAQIHDAIRTTGAEERRVGAELDTAKASAPGHPLVNTTDQWVNTTLRRALRQAIEADAEYIAIPSGDTVLSYNPQGDAEGNAYFYDRIVPKNLRNILRKIDKSSPDGVFVKKIETSQGMEGWKGEAESMSPANGADANKTGFTLFPLTDAVKNSVRDVGQPMFAIRRPEDYARVAQTIRDEVNAIRKQRTGITRLDPGARSSADGQGSTSDVGADTGVSGKEVAGRRSNEGQLGGDESVSDRLPITDRIRSALYNALRDTLGPDAAKARREAQGFKTYAYHGTGTSFETPDPFLPGKDFGFHVAIGTPDAANERMGVQSYKVNKFLSALTGKKETITARDKTRIVPVWIKADNSLRMPDLGTWESPFRWLSGLNKMPRAPGFDPHAELRDFVNAWIKRRDASNPDKLTNYAYNHTFSRELSAKLESMGYDSVIYKNDVEAKGQDSLLLWNMKQVRSAYDAFNEKSLGSEGLRASDKWVDAEIRAEANAILRKEKIDTGGAMFALAGERAKTADRHALATAKAMELDGVDRDTIWRETGWGRGMDRKWRFEIDDSGADFTSQQREQFVLEGRGISGYAGDVFLHEDLFNAYPGLALSSTVIDNVQPQSWGDQRWNGYRDGNGNIRGKAGTTFDAREMFLHEQQHGIQSTERMARGGNSKMFTPEDIAAERARINATPEDPNSWTINNTAGDMPDGDIAHNLYRRLAGEVEARTVQRRMNMTAEERRQRPFWYDYDVAESQQLVRYANGDSVSQLPYSEEPPVSGFAMRGTAMYAIKAFHGSPHDFDRFSMDHIGKGEGAQAYGHGLYFAESEGVARNYQQKLPFKQLRDDFRNALPDDADFEEVTGLLGTGHFTQYQERVIRALEADDWLGFDYPSQAISAAYSKRLDNWDPSPELVDAINNSGRLYEVRINAEPDEFLDWDKPLSQQSEKVKTIYNNSVKGRVKLRSIGTNENFGELFDVYIEGEGSLGVYPKDKVQAIVDNPADAAPMLRGESMARDGRFMDKLRDHGIKGIRYLDQGSRSTGEGTSNYVVFDESLIKITAKDGQPVTPQDKADVVQGMMPDQGKAMFAIKRDNDGNPQTPNLDMSQAARMERAKAMGFDTDKVWYHGTTGLDNILSDGFDPKKWTHFSSVKSIADSYQGWDRGGSPGTIEAFVRYNNPAYYDAKGQKYTEIGNRVYSAMWDAHKDGHDAFLIRNIRDHMDSSVPVDPHDTVVIFNPSNIRSVNAAFDPAADGSSNLMYAIRQDNKPLYYHDSPDHNLKIRETDWGMSYRVGTPLSTEAETANSGFRTYAYQTNFRRVLRIDTGEVIGPRELVEIMRSKEWIDVNGDAHPFVDTNGQPIDVPSETIDKIAQALKSEDWRGRTALKLTKEALQKEGVDSLVFHHDSIEEAIVFDPKRLTETSVDRGSSETMYAIRQEPQQDPVARLTSRVRKLTGQIDIDDATQARIDAGLSILNTLQEAATERGIDPQTAARLGTEQAQPMLAMLEATLGPERYSAIQGDIMRALDGLPMQPRAIADAVNTILDQYVPDEARAPQPANDNPPMQTGVDFDSPFQRDLALLDELAETTQLLEACRI